MDELVKVLGQRAANDFKDKLEDQGIRRGRTFSLLEDKDIRQMTQGLGLGIRATADLLGLRSNMRVQTTPSRPSGRSALEELAAASPSAERESGRRQHPDTAPEARAKWGGRSLFGAEGWPGATAEQEAPPPGGWAARATRDLEAARQEGARDKAEAAAGEDPAASTETSGGLSTLKTTG